MNWLIGLRLVLDCNIGQGLKLDNERLVRDWNRMGGMVMDWKIGPGLAKNW